ncbi:serine/threonine protein kinase [Plasmodium falciparum UGT5.1]|uniref:Cyclin-dependent kinase 2 homolog n=2 Tax=Plasmodium falciparum TaxID=5833 RepID=A0A0L1IBW9_PLAFA|nr:serine/threonine protein kinase [Plasmodium falciparum UGT5.1]KNG76977.1 serine/threonine protein kinase [Plasmodium falciparum IGH-CR14]
MKLSSCITYVSILCNLIIVGRFLYSSFLFLFSENILNYFERNNPFIHRKKYLIHKRTQPILHSSKYRHPYEGSFKKKVIYDNNYFGIRKEINLVHYNKFSFYEYLFLLLFYKKGIHKIFDYVYVYYYKTNIFDSLYNYNNEYVKNNLLFAFAKDIKKYFLIFNSNIKKLDVQLAILIKKKRRKKKKRIYEQKHLASYSSKLERTTNGNKYINTYDGNEEENIFVHEEINTAYGNYEGKPVLNSKYCLIKKIKNILKKKTLRKSNINKLDVIHLPIDDESVENKNNVELNNYVCKSCIIDIEEKSLYALKIREEEKEKDSNNISLYKEKSRHIQIYYDYEDMQEYIMKKKKKNEKNEKNEKKKKKKIMMRNFNKSISGTKPIINTPYYEPLKNNYQMINFTKRLFLSNPMKIQEKGFELNRYYPRRVNYPMKEKLGTGSYGEIWYAININKNSQYKDVVLKKFLITKDEETSELNAMREVYFGEILKNCDNISRFIEYFKEYEINETVNKKKEEYIYFWLVFVNEGYSLSKHLFDTSSSTLGLVTPSALWWSIKKQNIGMLVLKDLLRQILNGIYIAHKKGITHRDIKMENIFVSSTTPFTVRIGDWGSAVEYKNEHFSFIPSEDEETNGYQPPESLFGHMKNNFMRLPYYDMWSIGIVFLQFILGTKNPLEVKDKESERRLKKIFSKYPIDILKEAIFLQSLSELCLTPWVKKSTHNLIRLQKKKKNKIIHECDRYDITINDVHDVSHNNNINPYNRPNHIYRKHFFSTKSSYNSLYTNNNNNFIMNKLKYYITNDLINIKKQSFHNIYNIISDKYKSLISLPSSPLCSDGMCLHKYDQAYDKKNITQPNDTGLICLNKYKLFFSENQKNILPNYTCDDEKFQNILKDRDPSGVGLPNKNARDLLRQLLNFDYESRITAEQALNHPWFQEN